MNKASDSEFDLVIVGGGMVGSMLCAAVAKRRSQHSEPINICVLEDRLPKPFTPGSSPQYDLRVSALSLASQHMLQSVGAWDGVVSRRCCKYKRLSVWDGERATGRTDFKASDANADHLGHIVENRVLQLALQESIAELSNVSVLSPARLSRYRLTQTGVQVVLDDGRIINAKLIVGADGANSLVRQQAGIDTDKKVYPQHALVATINTALPQQDITWQRFVSTGPQAFLPLCGQQGSIVWYHSEEEIARLSTLDDNAFIKQLLDTFPSELGEVESIQARGSFPISKSHAKKYVSHRVALIGDAAHTVHPLAGQGVNIGLLDAAALAQVLSEANDKGRDFGDEAVLRKYQRWRFGENQLMITALDSIYEVFKTSNSLVQHIRSASLSLVDKVDPIKQLVMRHAMGVSGDLPDIAKPTD